MSIQLACGFLGYSKQAYYKSLHHKEERVFDEYLILELIRKKRLIWKNGSGRNLLFSLKKDFEYHNIKIGRDKFFNLLKRHGLLIRRKSKRAITTNSYHFYPRFPNKIKGLIPENAHHVWVSDITYVWIQKEQCFLYLFLITDMYSRKIIGYSISKDLKAKAAIEALKMATKQAKEALIGQTIYHSDRGIQYCCHAYTSLLTKHKIQISMTENSDPLENAIAERINKTVKEEFMEDYKSGYLDLDSAYKGIKQSIVFYNQSRPHRSLDMKTPNEAHELIGPIKRKWKNYKRNKAVN